MHIQEDCPVNPEFRGSATLGERGQIVIPSELRAELNINPGDKFMFFKVYNKIVSLIKADDIEEIQNTMKNLSKMTK